MSEEKPQFDSTIGGTEDLPSTANLAKFASCRGQEIQTMKNYLASQSGTKLAFQNLPKHMRRRAMSHNVKRLPRRLRQVHLNQMKKSGMPVKQKRPSRKFRRRPNNLTEEYTRRSNKKYKWLQTHIWHAKRFHMVEKWGYKIPCHPRDKAFRACYRATAQHCLLQDISYIKCVEISGDKIFIIDKLKQVCNQNTGLGFGAKAFIRGNREGEIFLFQYETCKPIGSVNFIWQPTEDDFSVSKLWLWVHPAFYSETLNSLIKLFDLTLDADNSLSYKNEGTDLNLLELKDLNRLRLTGPLSNSILCDTFVLLNSNSAITEINVPWVQEYWQNADNRQFTENQNEFWKSVTKVSSVSGFSPHIIFSLIVGDPRLNMPTKRVKCVPENEVTTNIYDLPKDLSKSPLWCNNLRNVASANKVSNFEIAEMRSQLLAPGSSFENTNYIPILLVQLPGSKTDNIGFCSGWDVILPSAWVKPFWISFVMRGCRVGGLREFNSILFEMGKSQFLCPDTRAGFEEENRTTKECVETFFKKPPNKRTNYSKFNISSPLSHNWKMLINDWNHESCLFDDFTVLRNKTTLYEIQRFISSKSIYFEKCPENCLIPVKLIYEQRGAPKQFSIICLCKDKNDIKKNVFEPSSVDKYQLERKNTRQTHKILLKKLKKRRKMKNNGSNDTSLHEEALSNYTKKMRALWLPEATSIRNSCSREVIGFVNKGGFSFSLGKGCGIGYIAANALCALIASPYRNKVLVRNTNSRLYRAATLTVIVD